MSINKIFIILKLKFFLIHFNKLLITQVKLFCCELKCQNVKSAKWDAGETRRFLGHDVKLLYSTRVTTYTIYSQ